MLFIVAILAGPQGIDDMIDLVKHGRNFLLLGKSSVLEGVCINNNQMRRVDIAQWIWLELQNRCGLVHDCKSNVSALDALNFLSRKLSSAGE